MRLRIINAGFSLVLGLTFTGCELTGVKKADEDASKPATAATIVGIWRTNIPVTTTTPPTDIKVTMQVDAAGTMILSQRVATGQASPFDFVEISKEQWTWKVENGAMLSDKTTCEYKDPATMQTVSTTCAPPMNKSAAINVKGAAWTVVENGQPIVFRKD